MSDDLFDKIFGSDTSEELTVESLHDNTISASSDQIRSATQGICPPISIMSRNGVYDMSIDLSSILYNDDSGYNNMLIMFLSSANRNMRVEFNLYGTKTPFNIGVNQVALDWLLCMSAQFGAVYNCKAETIGHIDTIYTGVYAYYLLCCKKLQFSKFGNLILARPVRWETNSVGACFRTFFEKGIIGRAVTKGFITEQEAADVLAGKSITLNYENVRVKNSDNILLV